MDLAVLIKNGPIFDWNWIEEKLEELNLKRFAHACFSIINNWFDVDAPVEYEQLDNATIEAVTEIILGNGVFGFADKDNRNNFTKNAVILNSGGKIRSRITYMTAKTFPDYETMIKYPGCKFLIGKKYLLPISWLFRFGYIKTRKDAISRIDTVKGAFVSDEDIEKRRAFMEQMGLLD